jgi:hypothetical protein
VAKRKPWTVPENYVRVSPATELRKIGLPILLNFGWALAMLSLIPGASGTPFSVMRLYSPDFGMLALASAVIAIVWGIVQVGLRARGLLSAECSV